MHLHRYPVIMQDKYSSRKWGTGGAGRTGGWSNWDNEMIIAEAR